MEKIVEWFEEEKHHSYASAPAGKGDDAQVLVFMIHGWPDDMDLWKDWVEPLNNDGMDVLRVLLPGYENDEAAAKESVKLLKEAGNKVLVLRDALHEFALKKANGKSIVIVGHDWGAAFAYMLDQKYPDFAERIVTIDVGPGGPENPLRSNSRCFPKLGTSICCCFPSALAYGIFHCGYQFFLSHIYNGNPLCCNCCAQNFLLKTFAAPTGTIENLHPTKNWIYSSIRGSPLSTTGLYCLCCCPCYLGDSFMGKDQKGEMSFYDGLGYENTFDPSRVMFIKPSKYEIMCGVPMECFGWERTFSSPEFVEKTASSGTLVDAGRGTHWARPHTTPCITSQEEGAIPMLHLPSHPKKDQIIKFIRSGEVEKPQEAVSLQTMER